MGSDWAMVLAALVVIGTLVAMASNRVSPLVALISGLSIAGLFGLATPEELFAGLSNQGVITVGAMLVIAKGVVQTGVVTRVTWLLLSTVRTSAQALRRLMAPMGILSALINTTPLVAMLIPATRELEQIRRIPVRPVLLPMAHVTTLVGSVTLIGTSSNLIIAGIAAGYGVDVRMLSFAPIALPVALVGWLVIYLTAPRLGGEATPVAAEMEWRVELRVAGNAPIHRRRASSLGVDRTPQYELLEVTRWGETLDSDTEIQIDDTLVFAATQSGVAALWQSPLFGLAPRRLYAVTVKSGENKTLRDMEGDGSVRVVAARTSRPLHDTVLEPGETCYITAESVDAIRRHELISLWQDAASRVPQPEKTWWALGILLSVVISSSLGLVPIVIAAVTGAVLMVVTGVLTPGSAGRGLDMRILAILAGSVGLGAVVVSSGLADVIANGVKTMSQGNLLLLVIVFASVTTVMTNLVTNAAAASILTPVALSVAADVGIEPVLMLALVGTCISFTLINPFSHQSNLMVMRPGNYDNATFARYGSPILLAVLMSVIVVTFLLLR